MYGKIHIGTSGWSYKHWIGVLYPERTKPEKYLEHYLLKFDCVELNSCFYHLPGETTVIGWNNRTPETFRFSLKLSRIITHRLQLANSEAALQRFFVVFENMKEKLGPILVQLPPGLSYDKQLVTGFFTILKEYYSQYRFAVEVRNRSWINDGFLNLLSQQGIAIVIADSDRRYPYYEAVTSDFVYLRFHGREQLYASDYSDDILHEYAWKIKDWLEEGFEVWCFFNNDYHGYAVKNALRLMEILKQVPKFGTN